MKFPNLKIAYSLLFFSLLLFSCTTEEISTETNNLSSDSSFQNEEVYLNLLEQGYTQETIEIFDNYYVVDNDMVFKKSNNYVDQNGLESKQTNSLRIRDQETTVGDVKFYLHPRFINDENWYPAFLEAVERWNSILHDIELTITTNIEESTTYVLLDTDEEDRDFIAARITPTTSGLAEVGNGHLPGEYIWLNEDIDYINLCWLNNDENIHFDYTRTILHEIGHVLGFQHNYDRGDGTFSGVHVEGSALEDSDTLSIMGIGKCMAEAQYFTEADVTGVQIIYGAPENEEILDLLQLYRYRNSSTGRHFYTTNYNELGGGKHGYILEGTAGNVLKNKEDNTKALYRYYNRTYAKHFYTTNYNELGIGKHGYILEGTIGYVYSSEEDNTTALFRYYNPYILNHFYTTNYNELGGGKHGYTLEGIIGYVIK